MAVTLTTNWQNIASVSYIPETGFKCTYYLDAKYSTQSKENNTTTIQTRLNCTVNQGSGGGYNYSFSCSYAPTVSGSGYWTFETETITTGGDTIRHGDDGKKTITLSATAKINGIGMSVSMSGDAKLPDIDRYPVLTGGSDFYDDTNPSITFTKTLGFNNPTVQASICNSAGTTTYITKNLTTTNVSSGSYTFSLSESERNTLRNASPSSNTLSVVYKLKTTASGTTYDGGTSAVKTMTIRNATPTLTNPTFSEQNAKVSALLGSGATTIVQNASTVRFGITASALKGASISKVVATHNGTNYTDTSSPYSFDIPIKSNGTITAVATDSRNNPSSTYTKTWSGNNLIEYKPVSIDTYSFKRQNETSSTIILNVSATYYQKTFGSTANVPIVKWKKDSGSWTQLTSSQYSIASNKLTVTNLSLGEQVDYEHSATFYLSIEDKLSSDNKNTVVSIGKPTLDLGRDDVKVNDTLQVAKSIKIPKNSGAGYGLTNSDGASIIRDWNNTNVTVDATNGALYLGYQNTTSLNLMHDKAQVTSNGSYVATSGGIRSKLETINQRISNANISHTYENDRAHMQLLIASSSMTSNKPVADGFITHYSWDNNNKCSAQLYLPQGDQGTKQLQFRTENASGTWTGWEDIYRAKSLYENASGTTGTVTLSETSANFKYLEIFYNGGGTYDSTKVFTPDGKTASLRTTSQETNNINNYFNCRSVKISGTSITTTTYARSVFYSSSNISQANNGVSIVKVLGYR